uniref:Uncharacterized protein n=1 Tax=Chromera velia CCMP2878 TaxID=1169474 RepID=A0A0G4IB86_9ALVE|eukprot:Cvel_12685.t1-p1 / transcript=Cvel_12685.t1 / gene=Cvel_12685 / organism=Chromera_velia_CCMP2878 / gene_product=hypothetical protein / transcript_product=hypothetical protein / location=Cvel_scaffold839:27642-28322(-) / protein_length=227 / sequence_SO=supercontig / SO=protein_coding / is_pseudo=false
MQRGAGRAYLQSEAMPSGPLTPKLVREESPWNEDSSPSAKREATPSTEQGSPTGLVTYHSSELNHTAESDERRRSTVGGQRGSVVSFHRATVTSILCYQPGCSPSAPLHAVAPKDVNEEVEGYVEALIKRDSERIKKGLVRRKFNQPSPESDGTTQDTGGRDSFLKPLPSPSLAPSSVTVPTRGVSPVTSGQRYADWSRQIAATESSSRPNTPDRPGSSNFFGGTGR